MTQDELERLERATFLSTADTGLWDMYLASMVSMFAIAPLLSVYLGDFLSAAVFLPVFALLLWGIHLVKTRVIQPRVGLVEYGMPRKKRLKSLGVIMLVVNVMALVLGLVAAYRLPMDQGAIVPIFMSIILLLLFSTAALFLGIPRIFFYGLLLAVAPPIGEFLFQRGYATHHGFPVVFGTCAAVILMAGIVRFVRFLPPPVPGGGAPSTEGGHE
jgi:MFS family permease